MTHIADTSLLVASFDQADPRHAEARKRMDAAATLVVPTEILVELQGVLKAKAGRAAAVAALEDLMRLQNVLWAECCDFRQAHEIYRAEKPLSFPDAIVVQQALARKMDLLSFDDDQTKALKRRRRET